MDGQILTFPSLSIHSLIFFRKSLSLHLQYSLWVRCRFKRTIQNLLESLIVVAYVDSVMSRSGRHLSIQADLITA